MRAPVTAIIPTLNAAAQIVPTLTALVGGSAEGMIGQVVIADGGSGDGMAEIAEQTGADFVRSKPGRGTQLRAGAEAARGEWLLFLHADTVPQAGWITAVQRHIADHADHAGYFRIRFDSPHLLARMTETWANLRARLFRLPYGDQGLLISRRLYRETGGFEDIPLMEDVAIARAIGGRRLCCLDGTVRTDAARYERDGYLRRGARNMAYFTAYRLGASPHALAKRYHR